MDANKSLGFSVRETNSICDNGNSAAFRSMHVQNQVSRFPDLAAKSESLQFYIIRVGTIIQRGNKDEF
jgi:hypothetical protein